MTLDQWRGQLAFGPWWLLYAGPVGPTGQHAHHAYQLVVHDGPPLVESGAAGPCSGPFVVIEPDAAHEIRRSSDDVITLFVVPESSAGLALKRRSSTTCQPGDPFVDLVGLLEPESWPQAEQLVQRVLASVGIDDIHSSEPWWGHPAVRDALLRLPDLVDEGAVDFSGLASAVGVSVSRLTHVFTDEVGLPLRSYARWLRLVTAVEYLAGGATITEAAHAARFSDGAHFSRVFKQMFGLAPSDVVGSGSWIR